MNEHAQNVLTAGGAPSCWRRGMKRDVARLNALDRASGWIKAFVSMPVGLREGSILGDCFASILAGTEHTAGEETAARRLSRPRFTGPFESETGERRAGNNEPSPPTQRTVKFSLRRQDTQSPLNELPRQADHELLCRLADVLPASTKIRRQHSNPTSARLKATQQALFQQIRDVESTRDASVSEPAPVGLSHETLEASQRSWQDELVRRIKRVISPAKPPLSEVASPEQDLMARTWSTSFSGPTAPFELLDYLSTPPRRDRAASNDKGHARTTARSLSKEQKNGVPEEFRSRASTGAQPAANPRANDSWPDARSRETSNAFDDPTSLRAERLTPFTRASENAQGAEDGQRITDRRAGARTRGPSFSSTSGSLPPGHPAQVKPSWSEFWEPLRPPEDNFDPRMEKDPSTSGWAQQIEPPTIAPQLPPLIPPQMVGMPVLPVAAATARRGARAEETADEDLDLLADRIKRILDEEARRHGIDV